MQRRPRLVARFQLDEKGEPRFVVDNTGLKHFEIALDVDDAPEEAVSVTYRLHETYWDPVREVFRGTKGSEGVAGFCEEITSYGDFDVEVSVSGSLGVPTLIREPLSAALSRSHQDDPSQSVRRALSEIRSDGGRPSEG